ncbi:MAG: MAPEG family protein [Steroidobacteraceae bacterium]
MTLELNYLLMVTVLTSLLWVPYILNRMAVRGIADTVGYPANPKPQARWAQRLQAAHGNAVENLVVFAALVLIADATGTSNEATVLACAVYFWARLAHAAVHAFGIAWLRTLAFTAGFASQMTLAWQLLA